MKIKGLPVIEVDEGEEITVAVPMIWSKAILRTRSNTPSQLPYVGKMMSMTLG